MCVQNPFLYMVWNLLNVVTGITDQAKDLSFVRAHSLTIIKDNYYKLNDQAGNFLI
jgi:hypothetical protein